MEAMIAAGADVDQVDLRGGTALQVDIGDKQKILRQKGLIHHLETDKDYAPQRLRESKDWKKWRNFYWGPVHGASSIELIF